jgi:succinate dehydrogenase / fumarate reductase membrane anchor subunit
MSDAAKASPIKGAPKGASGLHVRVMRSQLGRARGLGAARTGTAHWWAERLTSVALVPLTVWFVFVVLHLSGLPRADVAHWAANPINAGLLVALVLTTFHHMQLGLQVVVDDYIHVESTRMALLLLIKGAAAVLALIAVVAALKLAFTG